MKDLFKMTAFYWFIEGFLLYVMFSGLLKIKVKCSDFIQNCTFEHLSNDPLVQSANSALIVVFGFLIFVFGIISIICTVSLLCSLAYHGVNFILNKRLDDDKNRINEEVNNSYFYKKNQQEYSKYYNTISKLKEYRDKINEFDSHKLDKSVILLDIILNKSFEIGEKLEYNFIFNNSSLVQILEVKNMLLQLNIIVKDDYYISIIRNPKFWDGSRKRIKDVENILYITSQKLTEIIKEINSRKDLEVQSAFESIETNNNIDLNDMFITKESKEKQKSFVIKNLNIGLSNLYNFGKNIKINVENKISQNRNFQIYSDHFYYEDKAELDLDRFYYEDQENLF